MYSFFFRAKLFQNAIHSVLILSFFLFVSFSVCLSGTLRQKYYRTDFTDRPVYTR